MTEKRSPRHCPGCHGHPYDEWADCGDADCGPKDENEEQIPCEGFDVAPEVRAAEIAALEWAWNHYSRDEIVFEDAIRAEIERTRQA